MKVAHLSEPAEERVIFRDGLGVRERRDTGTGELVEWCHLDPAFAGVDIPLRERVARLAKFQHVKFARILSLETARKDRGPILVSSHVPGSRLSDVLEVAGHGLVSFEPGAGLQILRDVLGALAVLHDSRNVAHGALGPERVVLTASGRVVMVEHVLGACLDRLQRPRHQLWREWRVPTPPAAGPVRFDMQTDLAQAGLLGLAVLLGRPIDEEEYPHRLRGLLPLVQDRLARSPSAQIANQVVGVLERLAPVDSRKAFKTVREAQQALEGLFAGGGAALGASPTRIKGVMAAVAAIAATEAPAASVAEDVAQAAAPIVVASSHAVAAPHAVKPHAPVQAQAGAPAPATDGEIDIEALLALEAELEGGTSPAGPPAAQLAAGSAPQGPETHSVAEPVVPVAMPADDDRPLDALAQERLDLERQFAELVASVAPPATDQAVHLIPETPATSEPLVDARVLWSSMPAVDEPDTTATIEPAAPPSEDVVLLAAIEAAVPADDDARVPFADTSVFSRLGLDAGTEPGHVVAEEEPRPAAAIEHVPAEWWKEALPWRDEREPDVEALGSSANDDLAVEGDTDAERVAETAPQGEAVPVMAADATGALTVLDLEPAALVESATEPAMVVDAAVVEEPQDDDVAVVTAPYVEPAVMEDEHATDVAEVADPAEVVDDAPAMVTVADAVDVVDIVEAESAVALNDSAAMIDEALAADVAHVPDPVHVAEAADLTTVVVDVTEAVDVVEVELTGPDENVAGVADEPADEVVAAFDVQEAAEHGLVGDLAAAPEGLDAADVDAALEDRASVEASPAVDITDVLDPVEQDGRQDDEPVAAVVDAIGMAALESAIADVAGLPHDTLDVVDAPVVEAAALAEPETVVEVLTFHDERIDVPVGVDTDLELTPAPPADDVTSFAQDVEAAAVVPEQDAAEPADVMAAIAVEESCDDVTAPPLVAEAVDEAEPEPEIAAVSLVDAIAEITADHAPEEASIAAADASAMPDVSVGGDDAMAPVSGYRLFGDIEPILLSQDDEPAPPTADSLFGARPVDDAPSLAAASLLSHAPGGDDARDWRSSFLGSPRGEDTPEATGGGFFTGQPLSASSFDAEPLIELDPVADPAVSWLDVASAQGIDDDRFVVSDATPAPDVAPAPVEEPAPVDERVAAADADVPAPAPPQDLPLDPPADTPPVESPARIEMPAFFPETVPEVVIVDDGRDGNAWDDLPSELPDFMGPHSENGPDAIPTAGFGSPDQPALSAEPSVAAHDDEQYEGSESDGATGASSSKKKRRRSRRKKNTPAVQMPSPVVVPATTATAPASVPAFTRAPIETAAPIAAPAPVAAVEELVQATHTPDASVAIPAMASSLTPADSRAFTSADEATPELATRKASLLDREVPAWTPPSDFDSMRRGFRPSQTQPGSMAPPIHAEPLTAELDASAAPASTGLAGAPVFARTSAVPETVAPVPPPAPAASVSTSFGAPEALRPFEQEIRAVGMPDLDELQPRSGRATLTAMGEALGTANTTASRNVASPEPWSATAVVPPASPRGTNWKRFIAASVLIALFQGVAFAAWWWVQPGARGTLVVQTAKSGVEVLLDGKVLGRTPFREEVTPGRHKLGLRQGTNVREMPVEISVGVVTTQALEWPSSTGGKGNLQVTSNPAGAQVVIDGKVRGATPLLLEDLPAGDQVLMLRGDAGAVTVKAMVVADETTPLEVKIFAGWILVDAPVEVNLLLNGREKIGSSMDGQILLPPGTHRLRAVNDALGIRQWLTVSVEPGAVERVTLAVPPGTLTLQEEGEVSIDGAPAGTTPGSINIPPGTHEIVVRLADGTERRQTLTVRAGQRVEF